MFVKDVTRDTVVVEAPAKVNLCLQVLNRRPDGYHNINSLFQAVSLFDRLTLTRRDRPGLELRVTGDWAVPVDDSNLVSRAWDELNRACSPDTGLRVELVKRIPVAAGLGGGSSDAAALILGADRLFRLGLDRPRMAAIGARVGSDVPFFFSSGQARVTGRGEEVEDISLPLDYTLVLVKPPGGVSTAAAYAQLKRSLTDSGTAVRLYSCRTAQELVRLLGRVGNDFETAGAGHSPAMRDIQRWLLSLGASLVRMSGSGPTCFGLFTVDPEPRLPERNNQSNWWIETVRPVRASVG